MTAATVAPGKRAAKYNPATMRHSWTKEREHHRRCDFCGLHVENRPGGGGYFQLWDWPEQWGRPDGDNKRDKAPTPKCPGVYVPPAPVAAVEPSLTCKDCGDQLLAWVPTDDGLPVAIAGRDPEGDLLVVEGRNGWTVRDLRLHPAADPAPERRRRRHWCVYRFGCYGKAGKCPNRGRKYAIGTWCDDCVPSSRR